MLYCCRMCFSAPVSFIASGVLASAGIGALRAANVKRLRWYAAVPLIFSAQQFVEGLQWLADRPSALSLALGYAFMAFAFVLWPAYMPFAACMAETDARRKEILRLFAALGALVSLGALYVLVTRPLSVGMAGQCIDYRISVPWPWVAAALYVTATCASGFFSTRRGIRRFSIVGLVSFAVSFLFYFEASTSVWCFFAAALSAIIYLDLAMFGRSENGR